ncbi:MAG TPA: cache domain-containing protein [Ramlibacter sp.]|uniref:cache domain-containing protein n=1 Tax=Ramlibacter sp. TaxID=1917967 RepID=UPI002D5076FF|nr:cache domain-containing protein [Ramlibacter sp.]HZY18725.1 cache domain-containing protein [Ramlibacter sp.]
MHSFHRYAAAVVTVACLVAPAIAQERANKEEATTMANAAFEHIKKVGTEKAYKDFTTDKAAWTKKDLYVMVYDSKGVALAHGGNDKLVGKDMSAVKDPNGKPVIGGLLQKATSGGGWYDYDWPDPISKKMMGKSTYAIKQPNGEGFIGVGIYR